MVFWHLYDLTSYFPGTFLDINIYSAEILKLLFNLWALDIAWYLKLRSFRYQVILLSIT